MPMKLKKEKTPGGHEYLRIHSSEDVTDADAAALTRAMAPGAEFANLAVLGVVEAGTRYSPEARQALTKMQGGAGDDPKPVAIVVTSAPLRVMLSFIIRISGASRYTRFFGNEPAGVEFIDEQLSGKASPEQLADA
jgi:hypothetical protein